MSQYQQPNPYQQGPYAAPPKKKGGALKWILIGLGGGTALVLTCCIGGIIWMAIAAQPPEGVLVQVDAPSRVTPGEEFVIVIQIDNTTNDDHVVNSIDIWDGYTEGISIDDSAPGWRSVFPSFGFTTYEFMTTVQAGTKKNIKLTATAQYEGDFGGGVDVCFNNEVACVQDQIRTVVSQE